MDIKLLKDIFKVVEKTDFQEVEIVEGDLRVRIERNKSTAPTLQTSIPVATAAPVAAPETANVEEAKAPPAADQGTQPGDYITSPFVGTFYAAPSPDSPAYVKTGDRVKKGQILCIVEAMKLMNEIESEFDGVVAEILVDNAQPVEFGQKLFRIESA
jgi:acetyl-CoA carboxylase biotin carboxyl carrier protein